MTDFESRATMRYTLHAAPGSCSLAPHIVLEEIGEPYALALMSPGHPETRHRAINRVVQLAVGDRPRGRCSHDLAARLFSDDASQHAQLVAKGKEHLLSAFSLIEARLTERTWALGDSYSVVDPYLLVFFRWANRMLIDMRGSYPAWTAHARRLEERPAVQRALNQESITSWA